MLRSSIWSNYEKGHTTEDETYTALAHEFGYPLPDILAAVHAARASFCANKAMWEFIRDLKEKGLAVFAMSNISEPDWNVLRETIEADWSVFDRVFIS